MSTLQEIRTAIARLSEQEQALLKAELFATEAEPVEAQLEMALVRGLEDVERGRVRPVEEARSLMASWITRS